MKKMKKGFTIVELVIVIGVIAILSAVLIPTFVSLSSKAKDAAAKQEVADTYTAYVIDKGENANAQADVCIKHGTEYFSYTVADGWKAGDAKYVSGQGADAHPDTYNGFEVYEKTDTYVGA